MKTGLMLAAAAAITTASSADIGVVEATGRYQLIGASITSYVSAIGASQNPRLNGYDFGSVNTLSGQSLVLQNWFFENYAYNGGNVPSGGSYNNNWLDGANTASLLVTVMSGSTVVSSNSYSLAQYQVSGNNRLWQLVAGSQNTNLSGGLANGSYSVSFATQFTYNQWTGSSVLVGSTSTATSTASFTVIPAPGAIALLGVAGLVGARRRR